MDNTDKVEKEISIGGFSFKLTNRLIVVAMTVAPAVGGAFWGAFEFYNDYMSMRSAIKNYVSPDFTEYDKKLALMEESTSKVNDYTRDIKNDIKNDVRRLEKVVEQVERDGKQLSFGKAALRSLLICLVIPPLLTYKGRGLHDRVTSSLAIQ